MALVLGEAGLGKSRLATELLAYQHELAVGLIAHSGVLRSLPPFGPWAAALGLHAGGSDAGGVCRACGSGLGDLPPRGGTHDAACCAQALRHHFVAWIPGLLATASADRPIVVILDNAHHCHAVVWEMLLRLWQDWPASHVFVVATARPGQMAGNFRALEVLHALEQDARLRRVELAPLGRDDIRELTADTLGQDRVPAALVDWLVVRAQGNPRSTVGLLEALVECGADVQVPSLEEVPEKLARGIRTDLAQLDPLALALVELLAMIGEPADPDDLATIAKAPIEAVALTLERLVRSGMVLERQHDRSLGYALAHPLTREVVYCDIGGARRRVMHQRVAATLLAGERAEAASWHYARAAQAGDGAAIAALIEMARGALRRGRCALAWQTIVTLLDLLPIGDERWLEVFDAVCQRPACGIVDRTEHYVVEVSAVRRVRQLLAAVGDPRRQAEVRLWLADLFAYGAGDLDAGEREGKHALALCRHAGQDAAGRLAAIELAKMRGWAGDLRGEEEAARSLLQEAEHAGDQRGIAEALGALGHALGWQGRFDAAEDALNRCVKLTMAAGHSSWTSQSLALLASFDACRGHLVSARTRWALAAEASPHQDPMIGRTGAFIELLAGDLTMAGAHAQCAEGHHPAVRSGVAVRLAGRAAMAAAERGCLIEARRNLHAMNRIERGDLGILEPLSWWAEGIVARAEGRLSTAATALHHAVECYSAMRAHALRGFVLTDLAEVTGMAGDSDAAASAAAWAQDNAYCTGAPIHHTTHLFATSWALIGRGRHDAAAQAALRAVKEFSSCGYVLLAARSRVAYATAVRRSDRAAAAEALAEAAAAFEACGAIVRHQQASSMLRELGSDGRCAAAHAAHSGLGSLTGRERQVAELAAGGYTAAQIASQLHIGVRTVETHLARSYRKLDVSCKQQLVHRAAELGLTPDP